MDLPKCPASHARPKHSEQGGKSSHTRTKNRIKWADNTGSVRRANLGFAKQPEGSANFSSVVVVVVVEEEKFEVAVGSKFCRCCCRGVSCCRCVEDEPSAVAVLNGDGDNARSEAESRRENFFL